MAVNKSLKIYLLIAFSFFIWGLTAQTAFAETIISDVNATASSYYGQYSPDRAVDTSQNANISPVSSRWYCNNTDEKWLQLDLQKEYFIGRWYVEHLGSAGWDPSCNTKNFALQSSINGSEWTTIQTVTNNTDNITDNRVTPFTAKYVRLYITQGNQDNNLWASVMDFHVYTSDAPSVAAINAPPSIKEGSALSLTAPVVTDNGQTGITAQGWQICSDNTYAISTAYSNETLDTSYDGWFLRYFATNTYGTTYSNMVQITVLASTMPTITNMIEMKAASPIVGSDKVWTIKLNGPVKESSITDKIYVTNSQGIKQSTNWKVTTANGVSQIKISPIINYAPDNYILWVRDIESENGTKIKNQVYLKFTVQ